MAPQVHTASSAFAGHGISIVNVRTPEYAQRRNRPEFVVASLGRWLSECSDEEAERILAAQGQATDPVVLQSIEAMEAAGLHKQAQALRAKFVPLGFDTLRNRVAERLGFDPIENEISGRALAHAIETYEQVLHLPSITLPTLTARGPENRRDLYKRYPKELRNAGFDPDRTMLVTEFPVTYVAVGYSRSGFEPRDADLVAYKGRAGKGEAIKNLLFANQSCIYDPNCMVTNRGVDHGCLHLPETACQCWNWFLSRWELFGEPSGAADRIVGYWETSY